MKEIKQTDNTYYSIIKTVQPDTIERIRASEFTTRTTHIQERDGSVVTKGLIEIARDKSTLYQIEYPVDSIFNNLDYSPDGQYVGTTSLFDGSPITAAPTPTFDAFDLAIGTFIVDTADDDTGGGGGGGGGGGSSDTTAANQTLILNAIGQLNAVMGAVLSGETIADNIEDIEILFTALNTTIGTLVDGGNESVAKNLKDVEDIFVELRGVIGAALPTAGDDTQDYTGISVLNKLIKTIGELSATNTKPIQELLDDMATVIANPVARIKAATDVENAGAIYTNGNLTQLVVRSADVGFQVTYTYTYDGSNNYTGTTQAITVYTP